MPKNSSAARREEIRRLAAATDTTYTAALRRMLAEPDQYFLALTVHGFGPYGNGATIRDVRTGGVTALVTASDGSPFLSATATAEPGVFYLTADSDRGERQAYRLRVGADGQVADLAHLPGLLDGLARGVAVSPDGTCLAAATTSLGEEPSRLCLVSLPEGQRRLLETDEPGGPGQLSWAQDSRTLALAWSYDYEPDRTRIRVLDTQTAQDVFTDSHQVPGISPELGEWVAPILSNDGRSILLTVAQAEPQGGRHWNRLLEIPVAGGEPRTVLERRYEPGGPNGIFLWTTVCRDATGPQMLIVYGGYTYRLDPATGQIDQIPFPEGTPHTIAW